MSNVRTLKQGDTVDKRVISEVATADAPTADPLVTNKGFNFQGATFLHLYAEFTGSTTAATVTPWYFSTIAGQWFEGDAIAFTASSLLALVQVEGEDRVFFVVDSITGVGTVKIWGGYNYSHQGSE